MVEEEVQLLLREEIVMDWFNVTGIGRERLCIVVDCSPKDLSRI